MTIKTRINLWKKTDLDNMQSSIGKEGKIKMINIDKHICYIIIIIYIRLVM